MESEPLWPRPPIPNRPTGADAPFGFLAYIGGGKGRCKLWCQRKLHRNWRKCAICAGSTCDVATAGKAERGRRTAIHPAQKEFHRDTHLFVRHAVVATGGAQGCKPFTRWAFDLHRNDSAAPCGGGFPVDPKADIFLTHFRKIHVLLRTVIGQRPKRLCPRTGQIAVQCCPIYR